MTKIINNWTTKAGLEAFVVLVRNSHHCGYVVKPDSLQGVDTEHENIEVHGGITCDGVIEKLSPKEVAGFDCAHCGDATRNPDGTLNNLFGGVWRDEEYVKAECESLATQLINLRNEVYL